MRACGVDWLMAALGHRRAVGHAMLNVKVHCDIGTSHVECQPASPNPTPYPHSIG